MVGVVEKLPIEAKPGWSKRNRGYKQGWLNGRRNQARTERTVEQESRRRLAALLKRSGRARSNKADDQDAG